MEYLIIFLLTLLSCLLFEKTGPMKHVNSLLASYRLQLDAMRDPKVTDDEKQKVLLSQVGFQLRTLGILILSIIAFISPFVVYILFEDTSVVIKPSLLAEFSGIAVSLVAVVLYILIKKFNGSLFKKR